MDQTMQEQVRTGVVAEGEVVEIERFFRNFLALT